MLSQQMKSIDFFKLEDGNLQLSLSSNSVANYNVQYKNISQKLSPIIDPLLLFFERVDSQLATTDKKGSFAPLSGEINSLLNPPQHSPVTLHSFARRVDSHPPSLNRIYYYSEGCSQSMACIVNRFGECCLTLLNKLWYTYSYIYKVSSNSTFYYNLFVVVVVILMLTTHQPTTSSNFVSPSPHQSRTQSFTITDHTFLVDWSFKFSDHPLCLTVADALNNTYSEDF